MSIRLGGALRALPPPVRLSLLAALLLATLVLSLGVGAAGLPLGDVVRGLLGSADPTTRTIVLGIRLPRAILAALVGGGLALAGTVLQALLRNPLAEPYILGLSGGAAVGAVLAVVAGWAVIPWVLPAAAFAGALLAIALVFRIALAAGRVLDTRVLLLAGVVAGSFFNALILLLLTLADIESFRSAMFWIMGSLADARWSTTLVLSAYLIPAMAVLLALARSLNLIAIGEETASYLGTRVERVKRIAYLVASLLVAATVAVAGAIGFIGLVVPHALRLIWGTEHRFLLPASVLAGGAFLLLTDTAARTVAAPVELPVGVVTALVGVPVFVVLLARGEAAPGAARGGDGKTRPAPGADAGAAAAPDDRSEAGAAETSAVGGGGAPPHADRTAVERVTTPAANAAAGSGPNAVDAGAPAVFSARDLVYRYPDAVQPAVVDVGFTVSAGSIYGIIGPNGSGKSTVLRLLLGVAAPGGGAVRYDGEPLETWSRRDLARRIGVVPQGEEVTFPMTVRELVAMGRYPHLGPWRSEAADDRNAIAAALELCDVADFADRPFSTLSGGERQRARVARALAQEPDTLVLDEPTASLDISHEMAIFELLRRLSDEAVTVVLVTHNINLASRYAHRLLLLDRGRPVAEGPPAAVLEHDRIAAIYDWPVAVKPHPGPGHDAGAPQVVPLARSREAP